MEQEWTSLGSIVQKGKFSAGMEQFVRQLYSVLLPTLGRPTIPTCKTPAPQMDITSFEDHCSFPSQSNAAASRASKPTEKEPRDSSFALRKCHSLLFAG